MDYVVPDNTLIVFGTLKIASEFCLNFENIYFVFAFKICFITTLLNFTQKFRVC